MNIIYITASLPYGASESFSVPEIDGLRELGHHVTVVPMYPRGEVIHVTAAWLGDVVTDKVLSPGIVRGAFQCLKKCGRVLGAISLIAQSRNPRVFAKNAAVLLKGLWLAEMAQKWRVDHIHANWASCPATIALVASELSGIPWSFTGHRWDISEDNLLTLKAEPPSN